MRYIITKAETFNIFNFCCIISKHFSPLASKKISRYLESESTYLAANFLLKRSCVIDLPMDISYWQFRTGIHDFLHDSKMFLQTIYTSSNMKNESHPPKRIDRYGKHNNGGQGVRRCFIAWGQINVCTATVIYALIHGKFSLRRINFSLSSLKNLIQANFSKKFLRITTHSCRPTTTTIAINRYIVLLACMDLNIVLFKSFPRSNVEAEVDTSHIEN